MVNKSRILIGHTWTLSYNEQLTTWVHFLKWVLSLGTEAEIQSQIMPAWYVTSLRKYFFSNANASSPHPKAANRSGPPNCQNTDTSISEASEPVDFSIPENVRSASCTSVRINISTSPYRNNKIPLYRYLSLFHEEDVWDIPLSNSISILFFSSWTYCDRWSCWFKEYLTISTCLGKTEFFAVALY